MHKGGVGVVRMPLIWPAADPGPGGDFTWESLDEVVGAAARQGGSPCCRSVYGTPTGSRAASTVGIAARAARSRPGSGAALPAWRGFVAAAVDRYGRGGEFWTEHRSFPKKSITAWQIWNEQNRRLLPAGAEPEGVREAARLGRTGGTGLARTGRRHRARRHGRARRLAQGDHAAQIPLTSSTAAGARGTTSTGSGSIPTAPSWRGQRAGRAISGESRSAHDPNAGLWVTEIGWGSGPAAIRSSRCTRGQAQRLTEALPRLPHNRGGSTSSGRLVLVADSPRISSICTWCAKSGLLTELVKAKPAWRAFKHGPDSRFDPAARAPWSRPRLVRPAESGRSTGRGSRGPTDGRSRRGPGEGGARVAEATADRRRRRLGERYRLERRLGSRRDGRGLARHRRAARPAGRDQGPLRHAHRRPRVPRPLPARGEGRGAASSTRTWSRSTTSAPASGPTW